MVIAEEMVSSEQIQQFSRKIIGPANGLGKQSDTVKLRTIFGVFTGTTTN